MSTNRKREKPEPAAARKRMERYCAYQERCHSETLTKLFELGMSRKEANEIMEHLVSKGFLNEERFARAYAGGKFRQKKWGKKRILLELRKRGISEYCIRKAMLEIDDQDYLRTVRQEAEKYMRLHPEENSFKMRSRVFRYLISRGFESEQCQQIISGLMEE